VSSLKVPAIASPSDHGYILRRTRGGVKFESRRSLAFEMENMLSTFSGNRP